MKRILLLLAASGALAGDTVPAAETNGLPPLAEVLRRAVARANVEDANDAEFKRHYRYVRTRLTEFCNKNGELKKREEKRSDNRAETKPEAQPPLSGALTNRPIAAKPSEKGAAVSDTHSNVRGKAVGMEDFSASLLDRFDFTLVGRETINNRPTLVLDFKPKNQTLPERTLKDKFINKAAGRAWLDEADAAVAKGELYLTEQVNVLYGLVGAVWKFAYSFDRERTPEGWWYARRVDWHLEGRELCFNRIVDYHERRTNVMKFPDTAR